MIQGPPSLGSKLVLVLFLPSECKDHIKSLYGNLFFFLARGRCGGKDARVDFPSRGRGGYSWLSFSDAAKREASIRTPDARVSAHRPGEMTRWPGPEAQETKPGGWPAHSCGAAGMAGERPGSRAPASPPPGSPDWAEASTRAYQAPCLGLLPRFLAPLSFATPLSSFALTKASLGAFLGGAILPDSMFCHYSPGERRLLAGSSLRLHPCG